MLFSTRTAGNTLPSLDPGLLSPSRPAVMPLPLAHSLAGASLQAGLDRDGGRVFGRRFLAAVVLANAPDLDFVPGLLLGDPNRFHHGATHSLGAAILVGLAAAWAAHGRRGWPVVGLGSGAVATGVIVALSWGSHVALDMLTVDPSVPQGVPALWPLLDTRFHWADLFARADKVAGPASPIAFVASLASPHNLRALVGEAALLGPVLALVVAWRRRR